MPDPAENAGAPTHLDTGIEYGSHYFRSNFAVPYERNEHWKGFFAEVAEGLVRDLRPGTVLDAGCAIGILVEELRRRGVDARGIDISEFAIEQVPEELREYVDVASITEPLDGRFDLIVCIEVVEHLPPEQAEQALANLCAATDRLLLSTTPDDYGEPTHLNVQPPEVWSAMLARLGFIRDLDRTFPYITPWAALYSRSEEPLAETVRDYDRAWWRMHRENLGMRDSLVKLQQRLESDDPSAGPAAAELREEDMASREEILRLRDLLIGKEAELGVLRGRVAELDDRVGRLMNVAGRLQAAVPGGGRLVRLLRGLRRR